MSLAGLPVFPGKALGKAVYLAPVSQLDLDVMSVLPSEQEQSLLKRHIKEMAADLMARAETFRREEDRVKADILAMHVTILTDPFFEKKTISFIELGYSVSSAVARAAQFQADMLKATGNPLIQERIADIEDVSRRLYERLSGFSASGNNRLGKVVILLAEQLVPSDLMGYGAVDIRGIVTEKGSATSHAAILAANMEIPTMIHCSGFRDICEGETVFIDSAEKKVFYQLNEEQKQEAIVQISEHRIRQKAMMSFCDVVPHTADNKRIEVCANVMGVFELDRLMSYGPDGVGLFRSEFLFMERDTLPGEDEQYVIYRAVTKRNGSKPVTIRTLDAGADKDVSCLNCDQEENPALGFRAIRIGLTRPELLKT